MRDILPDASVARYGPQKAVMRYMRWSWPDLMAAPSDLVDEIMRELASMSKWRAKKKALDTQLGNG